MAKLKTIQDTPKKTDGEILQNDKGVLKLKKNFININGANVKLGESVTVGNGLSPPLANDKLANSSITINGSAIALGSSITLAPALQSAQCWSVYASSTLIWQNWTEIFDPNNLISISSTGTATNNKITINNTGLYLIDLNFTVEYQSSAVYDMRIVDGSSGSTTALTYNGVPLSLPGNDFVTGSSSATTFTRNVKLYIDVTDVTGNKHIAENGNTFGLSPTASTVNGGMAHVTITRLGDT